MSMMLSAKGYVSQPSVAFPDPYMDLASLAMPETMHYALRWCEFILMRNGTYRKAIHRVLSYFITDIEMMDASDEEKDKYEDFLRDTLGIYNILNKVGLDFLCYGNAFISVIMPFRRWLYCPKCFYEAPLREIYNNSRFAFKWTNYEFHAKCVNCSYCGVWGRQDRRETNEKELVIKCWNPHDIDIVYHSITGRKQYKWKIPEEDRRSIREGKLIDLENTAWHIIETVKNNKDLLFDKDAIFHLCEEPLAGIRSRGWGLSHVLVNFGQAWYVQILRRFNEALALDYVMPFRVISPAAPGGSDPSLKDPLLNSHLGGFVGKVNQIIRQHRRDPATWHVSPFPLQYQALGGDATQLAPKELLDQAMEVLLNDIGVPAELYRGSLQVQTAPAALRLFESTWTPLIHNLNSLLRYIVSRVAHLLGWKPVKIKLMRVTHADDLNRQMAKLQLMMGKQISPSTGLKSIGVEYKEEIRKIMEDQKAEAEATADMQEDLDRMGMMDMMQQGQAAPGAQPSMPGDPNAAQGQQPAGAMPGVAQSVAANLPTGPNVKITPQELLGRAQTIAQQIMGLPESQKDSELINLKKADPLLHSVVSSRIDDMRRQARNVGGSMVLAQQFGKTGEARWPITRLRSYIRDTSRMQLEI